MRVSRSVGVEIRRDQMGNMSGTTKVKRTPRYSLFMERNVLAMAILLLTIIFFTSSSSSSGGQYYHSTMIKVAQAQPYQPFYHPTSRPNVTVLDCEVCGKKSSQLQVRSAHPTARVRPVARLRALFPDRRPKRRWKLQLGIRMFEQRQLWVHPRSLP